MGKHVFFCKETQKTEDGVLMFEVGKQYIGIVSDDNVTLTLEGENGRVVTITGPENDGNQKVYQTVPIGASGRAAKLVEQEEVKQLPYYRANEYKRFYRIRQIEPMETIEIEIWVPDLQNPRYVKMERRRTIGEIYEDIKQALKEQNVWELLDYFDVDYDIRAKDEGASQLFPEFRWVSVFTVRGDSEGFYFHIEVIDGAMRKLVYLGKTLSENIEDALKINNVLIRLFHR